MSLIDKKKVSYNAEKNRKINAIKNNELNKECFDCGACYPEYISLNNGVFICKDCLRFHNKFPKEISNIVKNHLPSLNSKELEIMYIGGNQKLLEFINYDYPQLQKFKTNILYQTKAMQYYRHNLKYLVYGGPKPIKPNEKINAYELVDINECMTKNEKINLKSKNKIYKINLNNKKPKDMKRYKTIKNFENRDAKSDKRERKNNHKIQQKKEIRNKSLSHTENNDNIKRHKSFYKEMNKLFGESYEKESGKLDSVIDSNYDDSSVHSSVYRKHNMRKKNIGVKINSEGNNKISKFIPNTDGNNNTSNNINIKEFPIGHIYNNNYFTLSATKNIFMYAPNKDSIIYKHRKINTNNNYNNNKSNLNPLIKEVKEDINPLIKEVKEIYYKPKISHFINTSRRSKNKEDNLYISLQENNNNNKLDLINENDNNINNNKRQNKYNYNIKTLNTNTIKNMISTKTDKTEMNENLKNKNKNFTKDFSDYIKCEDDRNKNKNINRSNLGVNYINNKRNNEPYNCKTINIKKKEITLNDNKKERKENNFIIYRNDKKENKVILDYKTDKNKKLDTITKSSNDNNNLNNEIECNSEDIKNKTFFNNFNMKNLKKRIFNKMNINANDNVTVNKTEKNNTNPIRIEEGEEGEEEVEVCNNTYKKNNKEEIKNNINKINNVKRIEKRNIISTNTSSELRRSSNERRRNYNNNKIEEKKDEIKSNINNNKNIQKNENKERNNNKDTNNKKEVILITEKGGLDKKREYNRHKSDNFREIQNKNKLQNYQKTETSSSLNENINILERQPKFSIRNKYKMKKLNEAI